MPAGVLPFWGGTSDNVSPLMVMQEILGGDIRFDGERWEVQSTWGKVYVLNMSQQFVSYHLETNFIRAWHSPIPQLHSNSNCIT